MAGTGRGGNTGIRDDAAELGVGVGVCMVDVGWGGVCLRREQRWCGEEPWGLGGREVAQKLLDERTDVRERVFVCELWKAGGTNDGVELRLSLLLHIGVSGHCEEEGLDGR